MPGMRTHDRESPQNGFHACFYWQQALPLLALPPGLSALPGAFFPTVSQLRRYCRNSRRHQCRAEVLCAVAGSACPRRKSPRPGHVFIDRRRCAQVIRLLHVASLGPRYDLRTQSEAAPSDNCTKLVDGTGAARGRCAGAS